MSTLLLNNHTADQCRQINREEVLSRSLADRNIARHKRIFPSANSSVLNQWPQIIDIRLAVLDYGIDWIRVDLDQESEGNPTR